MLPIAIYGFVIEGVCQVMFRFIRLFCWVYSKNVDVKRLWSHEERVHHKYESFGNVFFDSQIHFIFHLVEEVAMACHVLYHWMFPI
jgi:hypothetical protein